MILRLTIIVVFFIFCIPKSYSQDRYGGWYQYLMSAKLERKNLTVLSQYRSFDLGADPRLFMLSAYLDFEVTKKLKPALGFMYLNLHSYKGDGSKKIRNENRPFQQVTLSTNYERIGISHRLRAEERFIDNPDIFILRLRYLLSLRIPFNKAGKKEVVYGLLKNEILVNGINDDFFDSDVITAGVGFIITKKSSLELGYINQIVPKRSNQYLHVGFRNSLDWRKKK